MSEPIQLWQRLQQAGLVQGEMPAHELPMPWYVRVLQGFAGWLAAWFVLGFISALLAPIIGSLFKDGMEQIAAVLGVGLLVTAWRLLNQAKTDFLQQLALALSMAAQLLLIVSLHNQWQSSGTWLLWAAIQATLAWCMPSYVHRVMSSFTAFYALTAALADTPLVWLMPICAAALMAGLWLSEERWFADSDRIRPISYGMTLVLLHQHAVTLLPVSLWDELVSHHQAVYERSAWLLWLNEWGLAVVWLVVVWTLLQRYQIKLTSSQGLKALVAAGLVAVLSQVAQGFTVAWLMMLLGFAQSNRILLGLGVVAFWGYLSRYYYLLEISLAEKAAWLVSAGVVLLLARWHLAKENEAQESNHA